jgi:nitroreductase
MELNKIIETRQSIRKYKDIDIPEEDIKEIIAAAAKAPSGKNIQNWHFIAIKNQDLKVKIADAIGNKNEEIAGRMDKIDEEQGNRFRKFYKHFTRFFINAPVLTVVYSKVYTPSGYNELKMVGAEEEELWDLIDYRSPGMQSLGAAMENFTLKAIDMGYGTCWLTSGNYAAKEIEALLKEEVGFEKEGYFMACMIAMGVPEEDQKSPRKKEFDDIYTYVE